MSCLYFLLLGLLFAIQSDATAATTCGLGYFTLHGICVDENECEDEKTICGENAVCFNTVGSFYCQCVTGFRSSSGTVNFTQEDGAECEDITECTDNKTICGSNAKCSNVPGSYYCMCDSGFMASTRQKQFNASQSVTCRDINECWENNTLCGPNANCTNTQGSYFCTCQSGFVTSKFAAKFNATQYVTCDDINECTDNKTICGPNAKCSNVPGSYYCMCDSGFMARAGKERFNAGQSVTCRDSESHDITVYYCMDVESSARGQKFNQTVLGLLVILWILMFFQ